MSRVGTARSRDARWEHLLPESWQGVGREALWRRSRARRVIAGLVLAGASMTAVGAVRPAAQPTEPVVVAARDVPAGQQLQPADLKTVPWPTSARVPATTGRAGLIGQTVVTPLRAGEPVTTTRLRSADRLPAVAADEVVVSIPVADTSLARLLRVGDRVEAWASSSGTPIGSRLRVVATITPPAETTGSLSGTSARGSEPPAVLVAVRRDVASALARAQAGSQNPATAVLLAVTPR